MFNKGKSDEMETPQTFDTNAIDRIAEGTVLEGSVNSARSIRIDGRVKGSIVCGGRVVVGKTGVVDGEIECDSADIEGTLNSTIQVNGLLELRPTAILNGEIKVSKISVEAGAQLNGNIDMGGTVKSISGTENKSETVVEKTA
ncbi:MAG: hypothetical protein CMP61_09185 [Flavobacteriales bacterium]|nr:hypothetical protein [Flavobacteriales bacterium]|tara:strand:+ start:478 stop:906 length:429 start_codon:yes stop_codon:yes gene_type:complete